MKPLVTETPDGNYQNLHNMTLIIDKEVYLQDHNGEGDLNLVDYCKGKCMEKCDIEQEGTAEDFAENMDCDCLVSLIYHMAVGHAELRNRLGQYEALGLSPEELKERACEWSEDNESSWSCSKCTAVWVFPEDGPGENSMGYCPECGRKIVKIIPHQKEVDEDE